MTADELVEELMEAAMGSWMACNLYRARVESRRVPEYTAKYIQSWVKLRPT